jgi:thioredoxin 1
MKRILLTLLFSATALFTGSTEASSSDEKQTIKPTIMDFQAAWCRPCRELRPVLAKIEKKYAGKVNVITVDVEDPANQELVERYGVTVLPTVVFVGTSGQTSITTGYSGEENIYWGLKSILR